MRPPLPVRVALPALMALLAPLHSLAYNVSQTTTPASHCAFNAKSLVSDACVSYETLDKINRALQPTLQAVTHDSDFFSYYRLNLYHRTCPFWNDETSMCGNIACAVTTVDDEADIPPIWRAEELGKLEGPKAAHPDRRAQQERGAEPLQGDLGNDVDESCVVEYDDECDDRDYCVPEDERATAKGDYVSLLDNPERFTGYAGDSAHMVWDAIYKENCFSMPADALSTQSDHKPASHVFQARHDLKAVIDSAVAERMLDDTCLEKRVFHRIISGMHASISMHICHDYLDQRLGTWGPNDSCYQERLGAHPDRLANLYFNYAVVLRAVAKLRGYLHSYTFCSGDPQENRATRAKVLALADGAAARPAIFDESLMFADPGAGVELKEDFRARFRNVSRLMDCVGCDKCRLWGKLQTAGYGTALKVLFEYDGDPDPSFRLQRTEIVALINTLDRISASLTALQGFRARLPPSSASVAPEAAASAPSDRSEPRRSPAESQPDRQAQAPDSPSAPVDFDASFVQDEQLDNETSDMPTYKVWDGFRDECSLIYRTTWHVLGEWAGLPQKIGRMAYWEVSRMWSFWLGLPGPQIVYEWVRPPRRDEL